MRFLTFVRRLPPVWTTILALSLTGLFLLGGCADFVASGVSVGSTVSKAIDQRVTDNLDRRKEVRDDCWAITQERVTKLRANEEYDKAEKLLRERYPSLLTERAARKLIESIEAGQPADLPPDECGPDADSIDTPERQDAAALVPG